VTDATGAVQFELPKPLPAHFGVRADINYARWYCACLAFITTAEVMQKGFMGQSSRWRCHPQSACGKSEPRGHRLPCSYNSVPVHLKSRYGTSNLVVHSVLHIDTIEHWSRDIQPAVELSADERRNFDALLRPCRRCRDDYPRHCQWEIPSHSPSSR
jgi:hypothetical protein